MKRGVVGRLRLSAAWACVALVAACGGGGGGGESAEALQAAGDASRRPLALTAQNVDFVAPLAVGAGEFLLQMGQLAADHASRFAVRGQPLSASEVCPNGGLLTVALADLDGSGGLSAGDRITADYRDCGVAMLASVLTGTATVQLTAVTPAPAQRRAGTLDLGSGLVVSDINVSIPGVMFKLLGSLAFDESLAGSNPTLEVRATALDDLRLVGEGATQSLAERIRGFTAGRSVRYDLARTSTTLSFTYESQSLGGAIAVVTPQPLLSYLNTYPDAGRVEVRSGGKTALTITPNFVVDSELYDLAFDSNGDGNVDRRTSDLWTDLVYGYLWSDGRTPATWSRQPYITRRFSNADFSFVGGPQQAIAVNDSLWIQFSRPPVNPPPIVVRLRDNGSASDYDPVFTNIAADVQVQGAFLRIVPQQQLRHGRRYVLELSSDGGVRWDSPITFTDALGNVTMLVGYNLGEFVTRDNMRAVADASARLLDSAGATLKLSAANSVSAGRSIAGYRWTQVGGTPLQFSDPGAARTEVRWGTAAPVSVENIDVELVVTDTAGETASTRITLLAVNITATSRVLYFRGTAGDYISGGQTVLVGDSTGNLTTNPTFGNYVSYGYRDPRNFANLWDVSFSSGDGSPLRVGAYENAQRAPFAVGAPGLELSGSGRGCNSISGRFDVLELQTDPSGVITRLAIDFEQRCEGPSSPPLFGSLRINSTLPIRP